MLVAILLAVSSTGCNMQPQDIQRILSVVQQVVPLISQLSSRNSGGLPPTGRFSPQTGNIPGLNSLTQGGSPIGPGLGNPSGGIPGFDTGLGRPTGPSPGRNASRAEIEPLLDAAAQRYQIPPDILKAVAWQESGWKADAKSFDGQHGKGVMQIDDRYHEFAKTPDVWDPAKNIDYGARFLREKFDETGSWEKALLRYNGGAAYPPKVMALSRQRPWTQVA